jgi:universal stress protein E
MTHGFKKVLVAVRDLGRVPRASLQRAAGLGNKSPGSFVELFHAYSATLEVVEGPRRGNGRTQPVEIRQYIEKRLERLGRAPVLAGHRVRIHAERDYPPHEAIIRRARTIGADLVVIEYHAHRLGARMFLTNNDWELIRACPCALLIAKPGRLRPRAPVLVAVDPTHANDKPARLDTRLVDVGASVAAQLRAPLHAVHAYVPPSLRVAMMPEGVMSGWLPPDVDRNFLRNARRALNRVAAHAQLPPGRRHLVEGLALDAVPNLSRKLRAGTVIAGAIARSALDRIIIGSTAERLLDALPCDVIVVKPASFRAPVPMKLLRVFDRLVPAAP